MNSIPAYLPKKGLIKSIRFLVETRKLQITNFLNLKTISIFTTEFSKVPSHAIQLSQIQLCTISPKQTERERKIIT